MRVVLICVFLLFSSCFQPTIILKDRLKYVHCDSVFYGYSTERKRYIQYWTDQGFEIVHLPENTLVIKMEK